ncbi:hypothetical protein HBH56_028740 [Parastagonospora nodorum]|uniref:Uncharacterized protein n=1 Tax=Phaeosphaeria nodorum (strain SN15 / ATCC MYA-4574 / FGSC 10173) TaxID=321614 RepID=A0A7U2F7L7_PHANO|nr:hypothetical protein HBH56_028740 [Parastagonospora nodorum]QRC99138.1 hypothetical protein JI435_413060 [Parastagonospora nodorum SN15]KAH3934596.1 hypothetical protein HBH54_053300 [Parastagonospora nodorum]KAH4141976.1 hypothetical protein HBH45_063490 [Parastagonospora nodorum]KAH4150967.1 hypothetical protein HBH44_171790 [Parastagonospora nodorum]
MLVLDCAPFLSSVVRVHYHVRSSIMSHHYHNATFWHDLAVLAGSVQPPTYAIWCSDDQVHVQHWPIGRPL